MTPEEFQKIMIDNGLDPLGDVLWARQALIAAALDARDLFYERGEIDESQHEMFCDAIVEQWPEI